MQNEQHRTITLDCGPVLLREYRMEDLDALQELTWQPEIYRTLPGWNVSREERSHWMTQYEIPENDRFLEAVQEGGGEVGSLRLRLGIVLKETGAFIGWCCTGIKDELPEPNREVMYGISRDHRNQGYTTLAVKGLVRYLFEYTEVSVLNAIALPSNEASNRVIRKSGFVLSGTVDIEGEGYDHYTLRKVDWAGRL